MGHEQPRQQHAQDQWRNKPAPGRRGAASELDRIGDGLDAGRRTAVIGFAAWAA